MRCPPRSRHNRDATVGKYPHGVPQAPILTLELIPDGDASIRAADATWDVFLGDAVVRAKDAGGGTLVIWIKQSTGEYDRRATSSGLSPQRTLTQMRCTLPCAGSAIFPSNITVAPFRPGFDEPEWLGAYATAFQDHPAEGEWNFTELTNAEIESWFSPEGFLLARDEIGITGFCWTKLHAADGQGEIFVIGVDPRRRRSGIARALVLAGLEHLSSVGATEGMLYVESENMAALNLYESLGFTAHHTDRSWSMQVPVANELGSIAGQP